jgi:hypothetical protein
VLRTKGGAMNSMKKAMAAAFAAVSDSRDVFEVQEASH